MDVDDAKWPTNYGAWLVGRVREWARYEGYQRFAASAKPGSLATRILTRAGFKSMGEKNDPLDCQISTYPGQPDGHCPDGGFGSIETFRT